MSDWYKCKGDCLRGGGCTCTWVGGGCTPVCGASQGVGNMPWPHLTMIINVCTCMQVWHVVCMYSAVEGRVRSLFFGNCYHDSSSYVILVACTTRICIPHTYCALVYATLPTKSSHNKAVTSKLVTCINISIVVSHGYFHEQMSATVWYNNNNNNSMGMVTCAKYHVSRAFYPWCITSLSNSCDVICVAVYVCRAH